MISGTSLLSSIPTPTQNWQKTPPAPIASIKVGDVINNETESKDNRSFFTKLIDNFKEKLIQKRIAKLESIPPEQRTPAQQSEIDANKQSMSCHYVI